jgi:hypothetical protein
MNDILCIGDAMRCVITATALAKAVIFPTTHLNITKTASATNLSLEGGTQLQLPFFWYCILPKDDTFPFPVAI